MNMKSLLIAVGIVTVIVVAVSLMANSISMKSQRLSITKENDRTEGVAESLINKDIVSARPHPDASIKLKLKKVEDATYTTKNIPIAVVFRNNSKEPVRLLDSFNNPAEKRVFFTVTLRDVNGSPFFVRGGGKIDIPRGLMKYIEIGTGEEATVKINVADFLPASESLSAGSYTLSVVYRNQYGDNCFKGTLESKPLKLQLTETG